MHLLIHETLLPQTPLEGLLRDRVLVLWVWSRSWYFVFLTNAPVMLLQGPYFENHGLETLEY